MLCISHVKNYTFEKGFYITIFDFWTLKFSARNLLNSLETSSISKFNSGFCFWSKKIYTIFGPYIKRFLACKSIEYAKCKQFMLHGDLLGDYTPLLCPINPSKLQSACTLTIVRCRSFCMHGNHWPRLTLIGKAQ